MTRILLPGVLLPLALALAGCSREAPTAPAPQPPAIPVSQLIEREITDYVDFTGRTEAVQLVDIRPRVTGYLVKMPFKEGSEVKEGELLFQVDPRPYQAQLDQAEGQVSLYEAQLKLAKVTLSRDQNIAKTPGAISQQQIDQDQAAVEEAEARLRAAKASLEVYKLNLEFTRVTSPITGQVSRYYLTLGNLVNQDQTLLTTIVSLDPLYTYFDVDEPTVLRVRKAINEGKVIRYSEGTLPVYMGLQGEDGFPHQGTLNFVNNQVNPATGSILVRGVFQNPIPKGGTRVLSPGMFVRVRLPIGQPHQAMLVIDRAIASDQGLKYVYVVNDENKIEYRRVTTGALQDDGLRVITSGVKPKEWVVVGALQQVRPKMLVRPDKTSMPSLAPSQQDDPEAGKTEAGKTDSSKTEAAKTGDDKKGDAKQPEAKGPAPAAESKTGDGTTPKGKAE